MKKRTIALLLAAGLFALGALIAFVGLLSINFNFGELSTDKMVDHSYTFTEDFENIRIQTTGSDVAFALSEDETCRVDVHEREKVPHMASVQNGTLTISNVDHRKWYHHIGFHFETPKMTVYLPKAIYKELNASTTTGDIAVSADFIFKSAELRVTTGDVLCSATVEKSLSIKTTTGDVLVKGIAVGEDLAVHIVTGSIGLDHVDCKRLMLHTGSGDIKVDGVKVADSMTVETTTGDVKMEQTLIGAHLSAKTNSGDVTLKACDAQTLEINTTTGDVFGTLLSQKIFDADATTGDVAVPTSGSGGTCKIRTTTGDITVSILS